MFHVFTKRGEQWLQEEVSFFLEVTHQSTLFSLVHVTCKCLCLTEVFISQITNRKGTDDWIFMKGTLTAILHNVLREEMSGLMIVIVSSCVESTYLEALYLPSSIGWWRQAYCSWRCRSSPSRCPHSGPHRGPRWWGYLEELRQETQTTLCKHEGGMLYVYILRTTWWSQQSWLRGERVYFKVCIFKVGQMTIRKVQSTHDPWHYDGWQFVQITYLLQLLINNI